MHSFSREILVTPLWAEMRRWSRRRRNVLPGAGAGAAETFYSESSNVKTRRSCFRKRCKFNAISKWKLNTLYLVVWQSVVLKSILNVNDSRRYSRKIIVSKTSCNIPKGTKSFALYLVDYHLMQGFPARNTFFVHQICQNMVLLTRNYS